MEYLILALQSVANDIRLTGSRLFYHETVRGFLFGFASATVVYALIASDKPGRIPLILSKPAPDTFAKLAERDPEGRFLLSYTSFQREYARVRIAFYSAVLVFLLVVLAALLRRQ